MLGIILACLTVMYFISFIIFLLRQNGAWFAPSFGLFGLRSFLLSMPWLLITLALLFTVLAEIMIRRYAFSYGRPLIYTALGVVLLVLAGGTIIAFTPLHKGLMTQAHNERLPLAGKFYRHFGQRPGANMEMGLITQLRENGCDIQNPRQEKIQIQISSNTRFAQKTNLAIGDTIMVLGKKKNNIIFAEGIRKIPSMLPPPKKPMK